MAFNAFLTQLVDKKALPFKTMEVWKADDFDAPMELVDSEFVEYANKMLKSIGGKVWMPYGIDEMQEKSAEQGVEYPLVCARAEITKLFFVNVFLIPDIVNRLHRLYRLI